MDRFFVLDRLELVCLYHAVEFLAICYWFLLLILWRKENNCLSSLVFVTAKGLMCWVHLPLLQEYFNVDNRRVLSSSSITTTSVHLSALFLLSCVLLFCVLNVSAFSLRAYCFFFLPCVLLCLPSPTLENEWQIFIDLPTSWLRLDLYLINWRKNPYLI